MTTGSPPSMTATHELVVPRSMPITLAMSSSAPSRKARLDGTGPAGQQRET
jgi:hypothetical protein